MTGPGKNWNIHRVGIVSTRLAGTDGVSLEAEKWADILRELGFTCYYFAGELDRPEELSYLVPEAHFTNPEIRAIYDLAFAGDTRDRSLTGRINAMTNLLKDHLYRFVEKFGIGLLIPQNALTIPMNIPLGVALTHFIAETGIPTLAHHHDFYWERDRFAVNAVMDYLNMAFPPNQPSILHAVINSFAEEQVNFRVGISAEVIPNIMDFENPPPPPDDYTANIRKDLGIAEDELLILQPTRVVQRKGIEHAIELVHQLGLKAKLVISHASGDEGWDYQNRLKEYSKLMQVDTIFVDDIIDEKRGTTADGRKIYTLDDVYPYADLVTYPSTIEGFGNAFLEAVYFKRPIVVNAYAIYLKDIKPKGFDVIELTGYVTPAAVEETRRVLSDPERCRQMVEHNYELGRRYFSYSYLKRRIQHVVELWEEEHRE
jgi:glycosyltransferase involved in cell wall biosynthesis